jgi:mobilization protein NikA
MGKIKGRPKKVNSMEKTIGFRVTLRQYFIIQQKAEEAGVKVAEYLRQVAINGYVKARWTQEERQIFKGMIRICNDINELAVIAKNDGDMEAMLFFISYRDKMDKITNLFSRDE